MDFISFDDLLFKHYIKFKYNVSGYCSYESPHHLFKIEDTIHYKSLIKSDYSDYEKLISTTKQEEHSKEDFLKLKNNFNIETLKENKIKILWNDKLKKYTIEDGCHRLSVIKFKNLDAKRMV